MLTDSEIELIGDATMLRHSEQHTQLWFCPQDGMFATAARLWERGYLDRHKQYTRRRRLFKRQDDFDFVYRLSDEAMVAQELGTLTIGQSLN